jgi:hypothetical protein
MKTQIVQVSTFSRPISCARVFQEVHARCLPQYDLHEDELVEVIQP